MKTVEAIVALAGLGFLGFAAWLWYGKDGTFPSTNYRQEAENKAVEQKKEEQQTKNKEQTPEPTIKDVATAQGVTTKDFIQKQVGDALKAQQALMQKDSLSKVGTQDFRASSGADLAKQNLAQTAAKTQVAGGKLPSGAQASATSLTGTGQFGAGVVTARAKQQAAAAKAAKKR